MSVSYRPQLALRFVLAAVGVGIVVLGLNVGLGGIRTLGWQDARPFLEVTNTAVYGVHDSHIRFLGGVFMGIGLLFIAGSRFSSLDAASLSGVSLLPSLIAELLLFPAIAVWLSRVEPNAAGGN